MGSEADSAVVPLEPARLTLALEAARAAATRAASQRRARQAVGAQVAGAGLHARRCTPTWLCTPKRQKR